MIAKDLHHNFKMPNDMKQLKFVILMFSLVLISCSKEQPIKSNKITETGEKPFIELDLCELSAKKSITDKEKKYATEVIYSCYKRAYEKLEVVNGLYVLNVKEGKEIQISEPIFRMIKAGIDNTNEEIIRLRSEGKDFIATEPISVSSPKDWQFEELVKAYKMYN
jgi:hypothetical protein